VRFAVEADGSLLFWSPHRAGGLLLRSERDVFAETTTGGRSGSERSVGGR